MKQRINIAFLFVALALPLQASSFDQGMDFYKEGKFVEAARAFEKSLEEGSTTRAQRRQIYLYMGKSYEAFNRLDKAISAYENVISYDKNNWRYHRDVAALYEKVELYPKALIAYKRAIDLNSKEPSLFLGLGRTWRKIGLYSYAEDELNKAAASPEIIPGVDEELSLVYEGQGRFLEAATACSKTGDKGPRLIYLAALAQDPALIKEGRRRLGVSGLSKETTQAYENLVQLLSLPPMGILAGKTNNPTLQALLKAPFIEGK